MSEDLLEMSPAARQEALNIAALQTGRPANLLEKGVWIVQVLDVPYCSHFGPHLVFEGGAVSNVHRVIGRFSEDVDSRITSENSPRTRRPMARRGLTLFQITVLNKAN